MPAGESKISRIHSHINMEGYIMEILHLVTESIDSIGILSSSCFHLETGFLEPGDVRLLPVAVGRVAVQRSLGLWRKRQRLEHLQVWG